MTPPVIFKWFKSKLYGWGLSRHPGNGLNVAIVTARKPWNVELWVHKSTKELNCTTFMQSTWYTVPLTFKTLKAAKAYVNTIVRMEVACTIKDEDANP